MGWLVLWGGWWCDGVGGIWRAVNLGNPRSSVKVTINVTVVYCLFQIGHIYKVANPKLDKYKHYSSHVLAGSWINIIAAD